MSENRYELRSWETNSSLKVRFVVGPGKFEGESILTEALYCAAGESDESIYDSADELTVADCFRAPFMLDTLALGADLLLSPDETEILESYAGAIVGYLSSGFVWAEFYDTTEDYERNVARLRAEYESEEDEPMA